MSSENINIKQNKEAVCSDVAKTVGEHTKFYDMRVKKLKEMQALGIIVVKYCVTAKMLADLFTKNVNAVIFSRLSNVSVVTPWASPVTVHCWR